MDQLPNEIHRKILCLLTPAQMIRLSETCKTINQLNFSRYMIPLGLEGVYTIYDNITAEERRHLHNLIYDSYLNIYELFGIDPFISYCKDMSCEIDKILGCGGGNRYFRPSFYGIENQRVHLSKRYILTEKLRPNILLIRRIRICSDNFLYGLLF